MARGFESKWVADQQELAEDRRVPSFDPPPSARRRALELARRDLLSRIEGPGSPSYHDMLRRSLAALEQELAKLP